MQIYTSLIAITGAMMAGAMSPGPSFLFVARNSIALSHELNTEISRMTMRKTVSFGLMTQLSNPKTAIVFASIYSALLPQVIPPLFYLVIPLLAFCIDAGWYVIVAFTLSTEAPRQAYLRFKTMFDSAAGTVMALLGLKLIFSSSK